MCDRCTRRRLLGAIGASATATLAGCSSGETDEQTTPPEPVSLAGSKACDVCGMVIEEVFGPNGQVFYRDGYPTGREGPAWYDSVRELFVDRFSRESGDATPPATYVTDYATVDYSVTTNSGDHYISGSVQPESFVLAADAVFVVESDVLGAMGAELHPFSERAAADRFVADEGGRVVPAADLTLDLVQSL